MDRADRKNKKRPNPDSIDAVVDQAMNEIDNERAQLWDFFVYCRRKFPKLFGKMDLTEFKLWNDARLAALELSGEPPVRSGTLKMANKILLIVLQEIGGVPEDTLKALVSLKNALVEDFEANPCDTASRLMYTELKAMAGTYGLRIDGELTPAAQREQNRIRERCAKRKLDKDGKPFGPM